MEFVDAVVGKSAATCFQLNGQVPFVPDSGFGSMFVYLKVASGLFSTIRRSGVSFAFATRVGVDAQGLEITMIGSSGQKVEFLNSEEVGGGSCNYVVAGHSITLQ